MTARVLVVDDVLPNVKLLEAKLTSEYFDVLCATSGPEALDVVQREQPDIVLLDVMMPGMNGFEVCRRIKAASATAHIPVIMITALDQLSDKVEGLDAGADDFLTKPVNDVALFARVKSLVRLKVMIDELKNRESTGAALGWNGPEHEIGEIGPDDTSILIVEDSEKAAQRLSRMLSDLASITHCPGDDQAAERTREKDYDLVIVSLSLQDVDGLRICSRLRSFEETRNLPILVIVEDTDYGNKQLIRALEMGVNDYLMRPVEKTELLARVRTQVRRKRYADRLWENFHLSMHLATTDAVTGLHNRHYMTSHLETVMQAARKSGKPVSLAMLDIDHFKAVNDTHGHVAGDEILQEFARRIAKNVRGVDLAARYGGEEFIVVMPETTLEDAQVIAERLRRTVDETPFHLADGTEVSVTISLGLATISEEAATASQLINEADTALYKAKSAGRNQVYIAETIG